MALAETFGVTGTAVDFFGGEWWLVGILLLIFFLAFLIANRVNVDSIVVFTVLFILTIAGYQIFVVSEQIVQTILFLVFIFVGYIFYIFISR